MAEAPMLGGGARRVALDETAFGARFNGPLLHESVRAELAARRRGTAATKTRGLVSGGNSKPWRQKGTGRARAGSTRAPNFTGGGAVFGPHPRSYTFKVNRKERRAALRSALSLHAAARLDRDPRRGRVRGALDEGRRGAARRLGAAGRDARRRRAARSARPACRSATSTASSVLTPSSVGVADIVGAASLLCSPAALDGADRARARRRGAEED